MRRTSNKGAGKDVRAEQTPTAARGLPPEEDDVISTHVSRAATEKNCFGARSDPVGGDRRRTAQARRVARP